MAFKRGGLNLTKLGAAYKAGHSAFSTAQNGDIWANVTIWENDKVDDHGNIGNITLNSAQGVTEDRVYAGNVKAPKGAAQPAQTSQAATPSKDDDLPF